MRVFPLLNRKIKCFMEAWETIPIFIIYDLQDFKPVIDQVIENEFSVTQGLRGVQGY